MARLLNKYALITGAAHGIGRATALLFAREGAQVAVCDIDDRAAEQLADEIRAAGYMAVARKLDVADEGSVSAVMKALHADWGRLDVLVNNAGIVGSNAPTHKHEVADWDLVMAVNVRGVMLCTKHAIPLLRAAGGGSIVNLSSVYGIVGAPDSPAYHASKGAVRLMSKTDALLYAKNKIRVNSLHPGFVATPLLDAQAGASGNPELFRQYLLSHHPIGRLAEPEDIAYGVLYLASDESSFVTGSELVIDGGYTAR
ncbi:SDR family NAD(P)-dependent oxidoreductase [Chitinimonas lacunae]|uniref:SDR family NAD(P)-dependent oxidoreductase n=1 Tax=Chitinimonas lacunae TaxID=1963018 RepID=A0ABV8MSF5_9NEIS